jgi:hypothetical protein
VTEKKINLIGSAKHVIIEIQMEKLIYVEIYCTNNDMNEKKQSSKFVLDEIQIIVNQLR